MKQFFLPAVGAILLGTLPVSALDISSQLNGTASVSASPTKAKIGDLRAHGDIRGTVTAISGSTVTLALSNGGTATIDASGASTGDLRVGDTVKANGTIRSIALKADAIKNLSLEKGSFVGSLNGKTDNALTLRLKNGATQGVSADKNTVVLKGKKRIALSDLDAQAKLLIHGTWNRDNTVFTASKIQVLATFPKQDKR